MMGNFFGRAEQTEHLYQESGEVEQVDATNDSVEVPEETVQPEVTEVSPPAPEKKKPRGKNIGGGDYVFRGDF